MSHTVSAVEMDCVAGPKRVHLQREGRDSRPATLADQSTALDPGDRPEKCLDRIEPVESGDHAIEIESYVLVNDDIPEAGKPFQHLDHRGVEPLVTFNPHFSPHLCCGDG